MLHIMCMEFLSSYRTILLVCYAVPQCPGSTHRFYASSPGFHWDTVSPSSDGDDKDDYVVYCSTMPSNFINSAKYAINF